MKYGKELAEEIKKEIEHTEAIQKRRDERIANWETDEDDCFLSIRVEEQSLDKCRKQLAILETDGLMDFETIVDENGKEVYVHEFRNKWGGWSVVGRGIFASSKEALLKKTGWQKKVIRVPVWVKFIGGAGGGLCSVYSGSYQRVRWHTNMVTGEYVGYPD